MTVAATRRWVAALLVALALWPLGHRALVISYDVSPWKLFGWAMYCVPKPERTTRIYVPDTAGERRLPLSELSDETNVELRQFHNRWGALGDLADREAVACAVFSERAALETMTLALAKTGLDLQTGYVTRDIARHTYHRKELACLAEDN